MLFKQAKSNLLIRPILCLLSKRTGTKEQIVSMQAASRVALLALQLTLALCLVSASNYDGDVATSGVTVHAQPHQPVERQARFFRDSPASVSASQEYPIDFASLIEMGMNPVGTTVRYLLPNTMPALAADLNHNFMKASNGFGSMQSSLANVMPSFSPANYQQMMLNRYQSVEEMVKRYYGIMSNPEQFCRRVASQAKSSLQSASDEVGSILEQTNQVGDDLVDTTSQLIAQAQQQPQFSSQQVQQAAQNGASLFSKLSPNSIFG